MFNHVSIITININYPITNKVPITDYFWSALNGVIVSNSVTQNHTKCNTTHKKIHNTIYIIKPRAIDQQ